MSANQKSSGPPSRKDCGVPASSEGQSDKVEKEKRRQLELRETWREQMQAMADLADRLEIPSEELEKLLARLEERTYSPDSKPERPAPRFFVANTSICTSGNVTTVSAQPKAGKSAAIGAMMASTFCAPEADCLGFVSQNPDGFAVLHFDTEQSLFDHAEGIERCVKRAKVEAAPSWFLSYCLTGFAPLEIRRCMRILLQRAADKFGAVHSLFIDGVADAVCDVNDPTETSALVAELHALAIKFKCPIVVVIHTNPDSAKTRGHLGSQLERKSETNLKLEKDEDHDLTVIWADKNRRAPIPKKSGPCFAWDDAQHLHVGVENPIKAKAEQDEADGLEAMRRDAGVVFAQVESPLGHNELVAKMAQVFGKSVPWAKLKLRQWRKCGVVSQDASKRYLLGVAS